MSDHLVLDHITLDGTAWIEIGVAFLAYFIVSFLWWGPLLGKRWSREMGYDPDERPDGRTFGTAIVLQAVATFLIAYVLWHVMTAFTLDVATGDRTNPTLALALQGAFYTWLGFFLPVQLARVGWEKTSWTLFTINAFGHLVGLLAMGLAFALL